MQLTKNILLEELIPKSTWLKYGDKGVWFIDWGIVTFIQTLRDHLGKPITINNWHISGPLQYRGFRPPECTEGAAMSQHRFGRGVELSVNGVMTDELASVITEYRKEKWPQVTCIENIRYTATWCHCDTRRTGMEELLIVDPV